MSGSYFHADRLGLRYITAVSLSSADNSDNSDRFVRPLVLNEKPK
jgi:hypothetical protein